MSDKQKKILDTFKQILPEMSKEDQNYLLGFGEGMKAALKREGQEAEAGQMKSA